MSVDSAALDPSALERKDREELATIAQALGLQIRSRDRKAEIVQRILQETGVDASAGPSVEAEQSNQDDDIQDDDIQDDDKKDSNVVDITQHQPEPAGGDTPQPHAQQVQGDVSAVDSAASQTVGSEMAEGPEQQTLGVGEAAASDASGAATVHAADPKTADPQPEQGSTGEDQQKTDHGEQNDSEQKSSEGEQKSSEGEQKSSEGEQKKSGEGKQQAAEGQQQKSGDQGDQRDGRKDGQKGGSGPAVDVAEPGNRRRRRRGRSRGGGGGGDSSQVEEFTGEPVEVEGLLDLRDEGYGFLRVKGSLPSKEDIYVSVKQARQFGLRKGDHVKGGSRPAMRNEKNPALLRIDLINGRPPDEARKRRKFEDLTPLFPDEKLKLETAEDPANMTARIVDLISPIGKGQRGLIVSPPKAGKTTIIKQIVRSVEANNPEVKLFVLQVDERPEEVTDMRRSLTLPTNEVVASTFDRPAEEHTQVAELTLERARRLVEDGRDVCIILDGITRLARAYNLAAPATGRIMSGGVDSGALYPPKKFFGAARNVEEGGSLTILGTALIETGSRMDEVIFEEFKGTGNMELRLDRRLAERRIYPAIDVDASSTRHEELLFPRNQLNLVWALRRVLSGLSSTDGGNAAALELLIDRMKTFRTNDEFLAEVAKNRLAAG
jgi:transcription termination factor Rho